MCFSPEASFTGGVIISTIGALTVRKVHKPSQILFASIPLFFGLQQFAEGGLWLMLRSGNNNLFMEISTYVFLIMALVIWPVMIPLAVIFLEELKRKKKVLIALLIVGGILSGYYAFCLVSYSVTPVIDGYHIKYQNNFPQSFAITAFIFYLVATITPLFVSSYKKTHLLGILMTLSCIVTAIFFTQYLTSVWCFFAALISVVILWILTDVKKEFNLERLSLLKISKQNN
jgi:hypothetical protein